MKIMDISRESDDCSVTLSVPIKQKKLKQALLPFQTLPVSPESTSIKNKKRKLSSSSPSGCKSEKVSKIARKENLVKKLNDTDSDIDTDYQKDKKDEEIKCVMKPNALLQYLQKNSESKNNTDEKSNNKIVSDTKIVSNVKTDTKIVSEVKIDNKNNSDDEIQDVDVSEVKIVSEIRIESDMCSKSNKNEIDSDNMPIVVLNRCDEDVKKLIDGNKNLNNTKNDQNDDEVVELDKDDENNQMNEELTELPMDLDRDSCKGSSDGSNENLDNTDSESETETSDDDDDNDDDKKSNDDNDDKKSNDGNEDSVNKDNNESNIEKTPRSDKNEKKMNKQRRLTPKQLEKRKESEKKKEERLKLKAEREKQRQEERMKRRAKKEERRAAREAEKEQKKKEKEQKELKKQMEIEQRQKEKERKEKAKEEEKKKKEEEREAKEEEKRKKEEERLEAERKKQKVANTFKSFFVPKNQEIKSAVIGEEKNTPACNFMPFEIKADMKMAPTCRRLLSEEEKTDFDCLHMKNDKSSILYLDEIKNDKYEIRRSGKTWPVEAKDDVIILEDDDVDSANIVDQTSSIIEKHRPKLLSFSENRRPAYWGTWRKKSRIINPRRPFTKDTKYFDYEVDSDDEWEEEEPGESLHGSDDEKDKDEENADENEYDVDNEFMVPHGYLSDEEARADEEDEENISPESQKFKLKILGEQFEAEMNEKTAKIKPKVIGCIWQGPLNSYPENISKSIINFLTLRQAWVRETPIILEALVDNDSTNNVEDNAKKDKEKQTPGPKKSKVPETALPDLIRLLHGNPNGRSFLIKEFITYWHRRHPENEPGLSQISVGKKIRELARRMLCPEEGPMHLKTCWYVPEEIRKKYVDEELTMPNKWVYKLTPKRKKQHVSDTDLESSMDKIDKDVDNKDKDKEHQQKDKDKEKKNTPLITLFTKKITQEEMKKQLTIKPATPSTSSSPSVVPKGPIATTKSGKRVALISVSRGEQFSKSSIMTAFSKVSSQNINDNDNNKKSNDGNLPGSSTLPITIEDSPVKKVVAASCPLSSASSPSPPSPHSASPSVKIDLNEANSKSSCNITGDKDSVKENRCVELNNHQDVMEIE